MQSKNNLLLPNKRKILWFLGLIPFVVMHNISAVFIEVRGVVLEHLGFSALGYFLGLASSAFMLPIFERNIAKKKANGKIWCLIFLLILLLPGFFSLLVPFFVDNPYTDNRFINTLQPFLWALLLPVAFKLFFHQALAGLHGILFGMVVAIGHLFWALLIPIISRSENNIQMLSASVGNVYLPFLNTTRCIFGIAFALIAWQLIVSSTTHSPEQKDVQETFSDHQESPKLSESVFWSLLLSVAGCFFLSGIIKYIYAEQLILRQLNLGYLHLILALLFLFIGFWVTNSGSRSLKTLMTAALLCLAITPFLLYLFPFSPLSYVLPFLYATSHQIAIFSGFLFFGYFTIQFNCKALTVASILFAMSSSIFGNLFAIHFFPIPFMPHIFFACFFLVVILLLSNVMRQRKQQLISLSRKYGDLLDNSHQAVVLLTHRGVVTYWSRTAAELFGYTAQAVVDQSVDTFLFDDKTGHKLRNLSDYHESFKIMSYLKSSTGHYVYCRVAVSYFLEYNEIVLTIEDNTKEYEDEKKIKRLAFYDGLTDLESRSYFCMHVAKLLESVKIERGALFFLDLDGFKAVNDQMGHEAGDELLSIVANRLKQAVFQVSHDVHLSRFGGDEFVVFIYNAAVDIDSVYTLINKYVSAPILLSGVEVKIATSMGVALYPDHATGFDELLRNADIAMYEAKALGKNTYRVFDDSVIKKIHEKIQLRQKLANAIADNKLKIYYQPLVDVRTNTVYGAEALLRWQNEELGWISPAKFIPIAEEYGLIVELSRWVLKAVAKQLLLWERDEVLSQIVVSVNIGPKELNNNSFVDFVFSIFNGKDSLNNRLDIELTEYSLMSDIDAKLPLFNQLRSLGFGISIDDFGTGYSSLSYLKKLPITKLKIDRSFITDLHNNEDDAVIARTIISMSRSLGIKVVAEGVEIQSQWDLLKDAGCDYIQGYLYSKPIPLSDFENLVKASDLSLKSAY